MTTQQIRQQQKRSPSRNHKLRRYIIIAVAVIAVGGIAWAKLSGGGTPEETEALFTVKPGDLLISVQESGKIQANKSVSLTCELEGQSTIISIVPEGSYVKEGDELVVLDSASLRDEIEQQQITVKSAESARLQASEALAIQENQNDSDIKAAQLARDFALIDLKKYTGEVAYKKALEAYQQDNKQDTAEVPQASSPAEPVPQPSPTAVPQARPGEPADPQHPDPASISDEAPDADAASISDEAPHPEAAANPQDQKQHTAETKITDLAPYFAALDPEKDYVDGDWHQQLLTAQNTITTAGTALKLAEKKLEGTAKLLERGYVTKTDWEGDKSSYERATIELDQANEKKKLIVNYDHPKQLAKFIADYEEAEKGLGRAKRKADSQLAQKKADLDAKDATYTTQKFRLDKFTDQLGKTAIKAPQPGLVVYASSSGDHFRRERGLVAEGESVYERQKLIDLPDLSTLKVQVNVHESVRDMIKPGQEVIVTVEALPGLTLVGHVEKVAILPDASQQWMNPDLTLYPTTVLLDGQAETLKPGMTAKAEIIVAELKNVLYVPVASVSIRNEQEVCFVTRGSESVAVPVETGLANNNYIEIKSGLKKGDKVLIYAPVAATEETASRKAKLPTDEGTTRPTGRPAVGTTGAEGVPEGQAPADREQRARGFMQNMTPEQRKQMEERLRSLGIEGDLSPESMTPERMKEIRQKMMEMRGGAGPGGEGFRGMTPGQGDTPGGRGPGGEGPRRMGPGQGDTPGGQGPGGEGSPRMRGGQGGPTGGGPTGGPGGRSGFRRNE